MTGQHYVADDAQRSYNESVVKAAAAGMEYLEKWPQLAFLFNTNSEGGLTLPQQPENVKNLLAGMNDACGGMSMSSANIAFGQLQDSAINNGRRVSRYKNGSQYITEISPVIS